MHVFLRKLAVLNLYVGTWLSARVIAGFCSRETMTADMSLFMLRHSGLTHNYAVLMAVKPQMDTDTS